MSGLIAISRVLHGCHETDPRIPAIGCFGVCWRELQTQRRMRKDRSLLANPLPRSFVMLPPNIYQPPCIKARPGHFSLTSSRRRTGIGQGLCRGSQRRLGDFPHALPRKALSVGLAHCPRRFRRPRSGRYSLCRALRHHHARRRTGFEAGIVHRARIAGRVAAHRAGAGVRESLPPHEAAG